jgi:hypothetical protein
VDSGLVFHGQVVYFQENNNPNITYTATLTPQNYNAQEFVDEIVSQMTSSSGNGYTYTGSFNDQSKKITINSTGNFRFDETYYEAGFNVIQLFFDTTYTGNNTVRIDGSMYIDVLSNLGTYTYSSDGRSGILFRIPLNVPYGSILYYENKNEDWFQVSANDMSYFEFRLRDCENKPWTLPSNCDVSITMKLRLIN